MDYLSNPDYQFEVDWFKPHVPVWVNLFDQIKPTSYLEIGSFDGMSACFVMEYMALHGGGEVVCIDPWDEEHNNITRRLEDGAAGRYDMGFARDRFHHNVDVADSKYVSCGARVGTSVQELPAMSGLYGGHFDVIYIDGSHRAPDVLLDAVLSFELLRVGGLLLFDDYLWSQETAPNYNPIRTPKLAIDAFSNIYRQKLVPVAGAPLNQIYFVKVSE